MTEIKLPKIALGAWAWGNDGTFGNGIDAAELKPIFDAAQVPIAWAIAKGTLPIVGVTKERHVADAAAAAAVELTDVEVTELEELADTLGINAIRFWEKEMKA